MAQLSDDCFAHDDRLLPLHEALTLLDHRVQPVVATERIALAEAAGRILAEALISERDVPPHNNSAVDGYAVYFDDLSSATETTLPVTGRIVAGTAMGRGAKRGEAIRIFTGAPMPHGVADDGPDVVMMQEDCDEQGDQISVQPGIKRGANWRYAGEDIAIGSEIISVGRVLKPQDIGLAASVGTTEINVQKRLHIAVFSTGNELRNPGDVLSEGAVFDANRYTLLTMIRSLGCAASDLGILRDDQEEISEALRKAAGAHDLILTSGGVSVGDEDHVKAAIENHGNVHFWRLAIKPGRPVALGQVFQTPIISLPGNPVAVMVTFLRIARPIILKMAGALDTEPRFFSVPSAFQHRKKAGRREWIRARLGADKDGAPIAEKFPRQGAGILSSMAGSDGLVELPEDITYVEEGQTVSFLPFSELGI